MVNNGETLFRHGWIENFNLICDDNSYYKLASISK